MATGKAFDLKVFKKILVYVKPYKKVFYAAIFLTIVLAVLSTFRPILIQKAIDEYVLQGDAPGLLNIILLLLILLVGESLIQFVFTYAANYLGQNIIRDIRLKLYRHLLKFKLSFFDNHPIGTLVTRSVSDIETIAQIFSEGILVIFGDLFRISVMILAMFWVFDVKLVLISLSVVPLLYLATRWFQVAIKKTFTDVRNQVAALNAFVQETLSGMKIVQLFNREEAQMEKFKEINNLHRKANIRSIWYFSIFLPLIDILSAISIGLVVWYGGLAVVKNVDSWTLGNFVKGLFDIPVDPSERFITLGKITSIIIFINMLYRPLRQLADRFNTLQMGIVASERVLNLLEDRQSLEEEGSDQLEKVKGEITFKDVKFGYKSDEEILKGISFTIQPGENLAIVGATGAGKSTIISLLLRFYRINSGQISLDGKDINSLTLENLRSFFALVLQDVFLFSDSILANITMGDKIPQETVEEAAKAIGIHDFIQQLPEGYQYNVRERGGMLSAGQRQLLAFLRAYVTNPPILILDEATSSIDTQTEMLIQHATDVITQNRTSIIIAHRLATIKKADKILVMDQGKIVETGSHQSLLEKNGYYSRLYEMQFKQEETV